MEARCTSQYANIQYNIQSSGASGQLVMNKSKFLPHMNCEETVVDAITKLLKPRQVCPFLPTIEIANLVVGFCQTNRVSISNAFKSFVFSSM